VAPAPFGSGLPKVTATPQVRQLERAMFQRVNRDRAERGLPGLKYDERLAEVARYHSEDMRERKFFAHESPTTGSLDNRLNRAGYLFGSARENLSEAPDVNTSEEGLLKSPGHFANLMASDVTHIGVGIVQGGVSDGRNYLFTQVFAKPSTLGTPEAEQRAVLRLINQQRAMHKLPALTLHSSLSKVAAKHIGSIDPTDGGRSLGRAGEAVSREIAAEKNTRFGAVVLGDQHLPDSSSLQVPDALLRPGVQVGLAVSLAPSEIGRPMLHVLFVIGR
jgi:uncharacterized protein YkwD